MPIIKHAIHCFTQPLTDNFNKSFLTDFSPDALKIVNASPIYKNCDSLTLKIIDLFPCFPIYLKLLKNSCISANFPF